MGREVRRVPANWEHPRDERGQFMPLHDKSFADAAREWKEAYAAWERGERARYFDAEKYEKDFQYWEWEGDPPDREYYRPAWTDEERTHFQYYETVSEGTPLSPPMPSIEALASHLATHGDLWSSQPTHDAAWWMRVLSAGSVPSLIVTLEHGVETGEEFVARQPSSPPGGAR